jgi:hypothetical protein
MGAAHSARRPLFMEVSMRKDTVHRPRGGTFAALLAALLALGLVGCQQFFTTSLASGLARSSIPIPANLSAAQAADLAAQAKANQDTKLATALMSSLVTQIGTPSPAKVGLESSAAGAAIVASGVSSSLTDLIGNLTGSGTVDLAAMLATMQAGATGTVVTALSYLDPTVIADPAATGLGATDYAMAAMLIAASVIPPATNLSTFNPASLGTPGVDPAATTFALAQAVLSQATTLVTPGSESAKLLTDFQNQFHL